MIKTNNWISVSPLSFQSLDVKDKCNDFFKKVIKFRHLTINLLE